ncbi:hypothetical protein P152DRAFT_154512 [Eremomyces bilateralis CBS 781.70]|uniref:Uncharacterized protein n=1 Tax=Eremomyces bilateralis CBS 781.70 TaxID=1392243 RepID=A0A6G1FVC4_9PEZI|nr:uncharacterized protein P152DRAFT_154512 [Eremomyces bilateralis CBS 781.70]KAF1809611.1 hypothetical protein P152DRAFT_154512 [Eremomyces bilateralis CBS 781.70]
MNSRCIPTDGMLTPGGHTPTERIPPNIHSRTSPTASQQSPPSSTTTSAGPPPLTTQPEPWPTHHAPAYQPQTPSSIANSPAVPSLTAASHSVGHPQQHQPPPNAHPHPSWPMVPAPVCTPDDRPLNPNPAAGYPYAMDPSTTTMHFHPPHPDQQPLPYHDNPPPPPNIAPGQEYQQRPPPMSGPLPGPYAQYQGYISPVSHPAEAAQGLSMMGRAGGMNNGHMMYNGMGGDVKQE